jgi:hypothetical protein
MPSPDLARAVEQVAFARGYTRRLLDHVGPDDWFRRPAEGVTHIAWQVGHLAMAEYRMALERVRGRRPDDEALISEAFLLRFGRDSTPDPDPARYPPMGEIRAVFDRVHEQTLRELPGVDESTLGLPPLKPHVIADTRLRAILWCAQHELVHAGQIALLRRLLGHPPLW